MRLLRVIPFFEFTIILDVRFQNVNCLATYCYGDFASSVGIFVCPYVKMNGNR